MLLRDALGAADLVNPSRTGACMAWVRHEQLPVALAASPQVAVLFVGMNDTLRSDFDPVALHDDCAAVVGALRAAGTHVLLLLLCFHDHSRVFRVRGAAPGGPGVSGRIVAAALRGTG